MIFSMKASVRATHFVPLDFRTVPHATPEATRPSPVRHQRNPSIPHEQCARAIMLSSWPEEHRVQNTSVALTASAKAAAPLSLIWFNPMSRSESDVLDSRRSRTCTVESHGQDTCRQPCKRDDSGTQLMHLIQVMRHHASSPIFHTMECVSSSQTACHVVFSRLFYNLRCHVVSFSDGWKVCKTSHQIGKNVACHASFRNAAWCLASLLG